MQAPNEKRRPKGAPLSLTQLSVEIVYALLRRRRRSRPRPASAVPNNASEAGSGTPRNVASKALVLPPASLMLKLEKGVVVEIVTRQFDWFATALAQAASTSAPEIENVPPEPMIFLPSSPSTLPQISASGLLALKAIIQGSARLGREIGVICIASEGCRRDTGDRSNVFTAGGGDP